MSTIVGLIEDDLTLAQVVDVEAFRDVCRSFSELFGIGVKIFDTDGKRLADVRVATSDHCGYLFSVHPTQVLCTNLVARLRGEAIESSNQPTSFTCFSGLRYQVLPVVYDGTLLGRVIFGPYRPPGLDAPPAELIQHQAQGLEVTRLGSYLRAIPLATEEVVGKVLANVRNILDVVIHNSFKMHMTSRLHLASIKTAFSDLERSNQALKHANERLQELDRLKSNFIATISHELRTPLTSVIGYSEMLLEGLAGDLVGEQRDYVTTILEKGESLLSLIAQVLDLARVESGNLSLHRELVDARDVLRLCVSDVAPQARKRELHLQLEVGDDVTPIRIDVDKVRRALTNLLGNAVKFTSPGGTVTLQADVIDDVPVGADRFDLFEIERNHFLRVRVIDTGIGIAKDKLERIFDAFFQVDSSSTREFGGTGLGLAIARNYVVAHAGRLEVSSELGKGSTFTVVLPYISDTPMQAAEVDGLAT